MLLVCIGLALTMQCIIAMDFFYIFCSVLDISNLICVGYGQKPFIGQLGTFLVAIKC